MGRKCKTEKLKNISHRKGESAGTPLPEWGARFPWAGARLIWLCQIISTLPVNPTGVGLPHPVR